MVTKRNYYTLFFIATVCLCTLIYSCNNSTSTETKKDSVATTPTDTAMKAVDSLKAKADSLKSDTSGKGGQAAPTGH